MAKRSDRRALAQLRLGKRFRAQEARAGGLEILGARGACGDQTLLDADVDFTRVNAYRDTLNGVEVWASRKVLKPGESVTVPRELRVGKVDK